MAFDYDLFIIGAGSAGVRAARIAGGHGARVAIAEESRVGGTCVIRGCVPKKLLVYASHYGEDFEDAEGIGWSGARPAFDWARLIANKDKEIDRLNAAYKSTLAKAGAALIESRAELIDRNTISVGGKQVTAEVILIATGSWPETAEAARHRARDLLQRMLPPGEAAGARGGGGRRLHRAGIRRHLQRPRRQDDGALSRRAGAARLRCTTCATSCRTSWRRRASTVRCRTDVARIDKVAGALAVTLGDGTAIDCDQVLYATGRRPLTRNMGLEKVGRRAGRRRRDQGRRLVARPACPTSTPSATAPTGST